MAAVTKFNESWNVGNYAGTSNNAYTFRLEVIQNSQSVANNTSNITVNKYLKGINGWSWYQYHSTDAFSGSVTDSVDFFPQSMVVGTEYLIHTYTTDVAHNSEGALALSITNTFTPTGKYSSMPKSNTKTVTVALDTIARASNISLSSSSINITGTSGSVSYTITPYSSSFTHTLVWTLGSGGATITNASSGSISYSAMLNALSNASSGTLTLTLTTLNNGVAIGSKSTSASVTVSGSSIKPSVTLTNIAVEETKISGYLIAGYSRASIQSTTTNSSGSSGVTTTFAAENAVLRTTSTTSTSQIKVQTDALPRSTINYTLKITATATDSRGNTASANKTATVYGYSAPTVSLQAYRVGSSTSTVRDDGGSWVYVTFSGALGASVNNQNSIQSVTCTYSGAISGTATNGQHIALSDSQTVTFTCTVADKVTSSSFSVPISGATYSLDLYDNKSGVVGAGFGAISEAGYVTIGGSLHAKGNWYTTRTTVSNLNQIAQGALYYGTSTTNRPNDYGVCYTLGYDGTADNSRWYSQVAFGTNGIIYFRNSINAGGTTWSAWQPFYGGFNPVSSVANADNATNATNATNVNLTRAAPTTSTSYAFPLSAAVTGNQPLKVLGSLALTSMPIRFVFAEGTTSATGSGLLVLGNGTASGTAGNVEGMLRFYSSSSGYVNLRTTAGMTGSKNIYLPTSTSVTLLANDSSNFVQLYSGTLSSGSTTFTGSGYSAYCIVGAEARGYRSSIVVPRSLITTTEEQWMVTFYGASSIENVRFGLKASAATGGTITIAWKSGKTIKQIYGIK